MQKTFPLMKGDIVMVHFPGKGPQKQGARSAVIVQSSSINLTLIQTTLVCPFTTVIRGLTSQPELAHSTFNGLHQRSALVYEQIAAIDKMAVQQKIGQLISEQLVSLEEALLIVFDIDVYSLLNG